MVKRTVNAGDGEPEQMKFDLPSEREHLLQVVDVYTINDEMGVKLGLDENTVAAKLEVVGGDEAGRTLLQRASLDESWKGFFATRLFLKAIGEDYKGSIIIDSDNWVGRQVYATVTHVKNKAGDKTFANIKEYNFDKKIDQYKPPVTKTEDIAWEE